MTDGLGPGAPRLGGSEAQPRYRRRRRKPWPEPAGPGGLRPEGPLSRSQRLDALARPPPVPDAAVMLTRDSDSEARTGIPLLLRQAASAALTNLGWLGTSS